MTDQVARVQVAVGAHPWNPCCAAASPPALCVCFVSLLCFVFSFIFKYIIKNVSYEIEDFVSFRSCVFLLPRSVCVFLYFCRFLLFFHLLQSMCLLCGKGGLLVCLFVVHIQYAWPCFLATTSRQSPYLRCTKGIIDIPFGTNRLVQY